MKRRKMRTPREYQKKIIDRMKDLPYMMIDASCGTGKTLTAIHIAEHKQKPTMVIAPKNLMGTWREELLADGVREEDIFVYDASRKDKDYEKFKEWLRR